ncbi:MAG: hypothetical protein MI976_07320 [Pseudomonadales bacterium]|nr:hypothetical protein [Pseudomonadales bacterium]
MTLYIGAYYPDRELTNTPLGEAVTHVAAKLAAFKNQSIQTSQPSVELCYMVPAKDDAPDFKGMRLHSYDPASEILRIEAAIPEAMVNSRHAQDYVIAALQDAVDNAFDFYSEQKRLFRRDEYQILIESLLIDTAGGRVVQVN